MSPRRALILLSLAAAACGDSSGGGAEGSGGGGAATPSSGMTIRVDDADFHGSIGAFDPMPGRSFAVALVTITNVDADPVVECGFEYFSAANTDGIVVPGSVASAALDTPCSPDLAIAKGASLSCQVAFEIPDDSYAATLFYEDAVQGRTAEAAFPEPPWNPCLLEGDACDVAGDSCCEGPCEGGACQPCLAQGEACDLGVQCCSSICSIAGCD